VYDGNTTKAFPRFIRASEAQAQDGAPLLGLIARFRYPCISVRISGAVLRLIAADGATNNYSLLRPIIGSMRVARSAGTKEANDATPRSSTGTTTNVNGSLGRT
jgi:hypothetical protein